MGGNSINQKSTKLLILEAAFSFYKDPRYSDFSMSELAAKVGISKPAIYRHFANKDAVILAMQDHFLNLLSEHLLKVQETAEETLPFAETIQFFADNPHYINYFIAHFSKDCHYEEKLRTELSSRGVKSDYLSHGFFYTNGKEKLFVDSFFSGVSFLFFIKIREKICQENNLELKEDFALKLSNFIMGGLRGCSKEGDLLFPSEISAERKKDLDELCVIDVEDFPEENRIFTALANVIRKYQMDGVTLERIAAELNMAKSSLYFYFDNKNELIRTLIFKEISLLLEICRENSVEAKNYSEHVYISMRTALEYFMIRPSVLPICGWLLQNTTDDLFKGEPGANNIWEKKMPRPLPNIDLGFPIMPEVISFWYGTLPVALIVLGEKKSLSREKMLSVLDRMFDFVQNGLKSECCK